MKKFLEYAGGYIAGGIAMLIYLVIGYALMSY